jgi:SNF2 family DNA or RNA helicase
MTPINEKYDWFLEKSGIERKSYQFDGVRWCVHLETHRDPSLPIHGGFIADEMGLGKTIMMIATFIANFVPRTLIVLPNILLEQWQSEIYRTTGHKALIYHGKNKKLISLEQLKSAFIVLTTYNTVAVTKKQLALDPSLSKDRELHKIRWDRIVFDEAHHLRNKNSRWIGCKHLKSKIRWLISGTPVQNKRRDFFNLCSSLKMPASYYADTDNLRHLVTNFVLKRSKKQVGISLPNLNLDNESVLWKSESERKLSHDIHRALAMSAQKLKLFMHARQSCILPSLLKDNVDSMISNKVISKDNFNSGALLCSSKMDAVVSTILGRKGNGNGKLVFCHFRGEIDSLISRLREGGISNICTFDGRVSQATRFRMLRKKEDYEVIVLQIQTGCEGLNLQQNFSEVYFLSPNWNPAIEDQAVARCHRIGQTKPVSVFRFHMDSTFEKGGAKNDLNEVGAENEFLTLDQYISTVQDGKREISNEILPICQM